MRTCGENLWGIEGLVLNPVILAAMPDYKWELSLGYLLQFCICEASVYYLFRRMMEKVGFPPCRHRMKFAAYLLLYVLALYGVGEILYKLFGKMVLVRISPWPLTFVCLLIGAILLGDPLCLVWKGRAFERTHLKNPYCFYRISCYTGGTAKGGSVWKL